MFEAPINEGAEIFIWIVCILGGLVAGVIAVDTYKSEKKKEEK